MSIQNSEMIVKLNSTNSDAVVTIVQPDGVTREKCISVEDLAAALATRHSMSTGLMPSNTRFFMGDTNKYIIVIESPAKIRRFLLHSNTQAYEQGERYQPRELNIPFPNCVFIFSISARRISNTWVFSTANKISAMDEELCWFPYGNVFEDGHVCWGRVVLPEINSPMNLVGVMASFFDAPFNGDLTNYTTFNSPSENVNDFWSLVSYMENQASFSSSILRSQRRTLQQIINSISR